MATERIVFKDGIARFVYSDRLATMTANLGPATVSRASHVEPWPGGNRAWGADMSPVGGGLLGPFATRGEALDAERAWLRTERGL